VKSVEILSIGNEIVSGKTVNTNATYLAERLLAIGVRVDRVTSLPDRVDVLKQELRKIIKRASFIIMTGGLGPTSDDRTREVVSDVLGVPLIFNEEVEKDLKARFGETFPTIPDQSMVLKGAQILHNPLGTAPGFILEKEECTLIILPGVPSQMEEMVERDVMPYLANKVRTHTFQRSLYFCHLEEHEVDPLLREVEKKYPEVEIGICPGLGILSLFLSVEAKNGKEADQKLAPVIDRFRVPFSTHLFSTKSKRIEEALQEAMCKRAKTLALAESCTGGAMASRITGVSGASAYFLGSIVSYSNDVKKTILGVSSTTLEKWGAVSKETIIEMMQGVFRLTKADYAIAVSGVAGPTGGTPEKPVGTVWAAIGEEGEKPFTTHFTAKGRMRRDLVIEYSVTHLLSALWRWIEHEVVPSHR
jgi:nicotinamide-nucleotide amidase